MVRTPEHGPRPRKLHPFRRVILSGALAGGIAVGEAALPATASTPESLKPKAPSSLLEKQKKPKDGKQAEGQTKRGEKSTAQEKQIEQIQENFRAFFSLTNEDIATWANTTSPDGTNNVINYDGAPWGYPAVLSSAGSQSHITNLGDRAQIVYNGMFKIVTEPNLSLLFFDPKLEYYEFVGVNLGTIQVPIRSSKNKGRVSITFIGLKFPSYFGGENYILPVISNIKDPGNPLLLNEPLDLLSDKTYYTEAKNKNDLSSDSVNPIQYDVKREVLLNKLKKTVGNPIIISSNLGNPPTENQKPQYRFMSPGVKSFYSNFQLPLQGQVDSFKANLSLASNQGSILTKDSFSPAYITEGFSNLDEALSILGDSIVGFIQGSEPVLKKQKK